MSKGTKAELHAVYVFQVPLELPLTAEIPQDNRGEEVLARVEAISAEQKCKLHAHLLHARHPGPAIVLEAEDRNMDLIVLGIPYQHRVRSCALGPTATYILKNAPSQVIFWRERAPATSMARG